MADSHGWLFMHEEKETGLVSFTKLLRGYRARINVWTTKMTVSTAINHPKTGKSQMYRKKVGSALLNKIFINPRVHTDRGYKLTKGKRK